MFAESGILIIFGKNDQNGSFLVPFLTGSGVKNLGQSGVLVSGRLEEYLKFSAKPKILLLLHSRKVNKF